MVQYVSACNDDFKEAFEKLRDEEAALAFCESEGFQVGVTATRSQEHHQSSKALVAAVTGIAKSACERRGVSLDPNPQRRAIWCSERGLHVSARNLDGAVPGLANPSIVWEIKEYWGTTKGGSKMSDAVYECQLVGREIRDYEQRSDAKIDHAVFLDGRYQWSFRKSDLVRFIDLFHQRIIDHLLIGSEVETEWATLLESDLIGEGSSS